MRLTENQRAIAEVISKHRRGDGYDLNACLKELPHTSRGTISKVFSKLRARNWAVLLEGSKLEVNRRFPEMGQQKYIGTETRGYKTNSYDYASIVPLSPEFRHLMKDLIVCFWCALQLGYQGDYLSWLRAIAWEYWRAKGIDPYNVVESAGLPTDHIEEYIS